MFSRLLTWLDTRRGFLVSVGMLSVGMALLRLVRITFPTSRVFDEVYSPVFAWNFLRGESFFDVHPLLAELPQTVGLLLFGDTPLGWRFSPWLWGIVFTWGAALVGWLLSRRFLGGVLAAFLVSFDTAYFIYGRTGLPDMFLLSQLSLALACFFGSIRIQNRRWAIVLALACGIFLGNVVAAKWLGLAAIGVIWLWIALQFWQVRRRNSWTPELPHIPMWLFPVAFLLVPLAVYLLWLLPLLQVTSVGSPEMGFVRHAYEWHWQVWNYHARLDAEHPYGSTWWEWPILHHPVLFFYETVEGGRRVINASGNIVLWWSGFAALIGTGGYVVWTSLRGAKRRSHRNSGAPPDGGGNPETHQANNEIASSAVEGGFLAKTTILWLVASALLFWLPWMFISRVSFNYHFFASFFFEVLLLVLLLLYALDRPQYRSVALLFCVFVVLGFVILYPSATGLLIPSSITNIRWFFP